MSEIFEEYEQQFLEYIRDASRDIPQLKQTPPQQRKKVEDDILTNLSKSDKLLRDMEREQSGVTNPTQREQLKNKVTSYTSNLKNLRKEFKIAQESSNKQDLFGKDLEEGGGENWTSDQGRQKMRENTDQLSGQQKYIDTMLTTVEETNNMADGTMVDLSGQGERIKSQIGRTTGIGDAVQGARTIIGRMTRQQVIQSIVLVVIILVLIAVIGLILFFVIRPYLPSWGGSGSGSV